MESVFLLRLRPYLLTFSTLVADEIRANITLFPHFQEVNWLSNTFLLPLWHKIKQQTTVNLKKRVKIYGQTFISSSKQKVFSADPNEKIRNTVLINFAGFWSILLEQRESDY